MDENVSKIIASASVVFLVVAALSLFFILYRDSTDTVSLINRGINDRGALFESSGQKAQNTEVQGSEIVGNIKNGLETDIFIDSVYISCSEDVQAFDFSTIDKTAWYSVRYLFNPTGEVTSVQYVKR
ncbi:MAG: hypothetical protein KBA53_11905 [Thermoclostridium sp.]|nr:hypothetical protein [Thermoclostridium sp.]